ncbi:MAG: hypothetical protein ACYTE8_11205 [Planctomycetota bacterium]|jgi:hypothetical protein
MKVGKNIEKVIRKLDLSLDINTKTDEAVLSKILEAQEKTKQTKLAAIRPDIWRIIMNKPITKLTTAAAVLLMVSLVTTIFLTSTPTAFAIDRVIDAYDSIRFIYIKEFKPDREVPNEFWIQSDETGRVVKARYCLPKTEDGTKIITWTPERTELWFKNKGGYLIMQSNKVENWMQYLVMQCQPKIIMQQLLEKEKSGEVEIDIQQPKDKHSSGIITSTSKAKSKKEIYYVNPATDLITHIEFYSIEDSGDVLLSTMEFHDYNVPINEKMFSLGDEIPDDVWISDQLNQLVGVSQGDMTDEQAAEETVRQFYQALIDKDYKKAGLIMGGMQEEFVKNNFVKANITKIISIGTAEPQLWWVKRGFKVTCELEIINSDGQKVLGMAGPYVRPGDDEMHPDSWNITGGMDVIEVLHDNEKYKKMTPKEVAEALFTACAEENWDEFQKYWGSGHEKMKDYLGGLEIISIGEPFQKGAYPGWFVPYEIKLKNGHVKKHNLAIRNDNATKRYMFDGGI